MQGAVVVAIAAAIGNLLQGWDNATIAGAVLYIKREFHLETQPAVEGLVVATSLIGATIITTFSGPVSDSVGRRPMLIASSLLYFAGGLIMLWSPSVAVLLLARLVDGFGVGLAVTLVPVYISETAPPEIRGLLNTLPQFTGSFGMFFSYCMIFYMTLGVAAGGPSWRLMLGVLSVPSLAYLALTVLYLPESPRWLVSKGRMKEARAILQMLRGRDDVSGEMALLVEGLGSGGDTVIEEYVLGPSDQSAAGPGDADLVGHDQQQQQVTLYGPEQGLSWVAQQVQQGSVLGSALELATSASRQGSMYEQLKDPVVTLLGSVHDKMPAAGDGGGAGSSARGSTLFPNLGSMLSVAERPGDWDEENAMPPPDGDDDDDDDEDEEYLSDDDQLQAAPLHAPLLSRQSTDVDTKAPKRDQSMQRYSSMTGGETASTMGIGGGWQLAWKWTEKVGPDGVKRGGVKRMYLHEDAGGLGDSSSSSAAGPEYVHAAALVSRSMLYTKDVMIGQSPTPAFENPPDTVATTTKQEAGARWRELLEPGVRRALFCGVMIQILQQFSGINGVLYYTPQILDQAGVSVLLASLGLSADSTSILISGLTTLLMLPSIGLAMRLMDVSGRRSLLLWTIPVLILALLVLIVANVVSMPTTVHAALSTGSVILYFCCFVMGFGPIPNILCAEIFPTRVRGLCIAICSLTFWLGDIAVTYSLPVMLSSVGLAGVFGFYAAVCCLALVFVYIKVPETKGFPLEVIIEFFNIGAKATPTTEDNHVIPN
ncbi:unnamed protein product [Urochloa decumbens]|uniref:Major facilitator superfamily (MFS) profile domain-containing protein n=1 Tax=Urochloa decumbens TaxID=240449 RepID=A0ABC8VFJ3_9POAL